MSDLDPGDLPSSVAVSPAFQGSGSEEPEGGDEEVAYSDGETDDEESASTEEEDSAEDSFLMEHVYENGRRYANDDYCFPNDEAEETRLSVIHQVHLILLEGELTLSRVPRNVKRILDIGTGPGDWAIAMGELHPQAEVVTTDITTYRPINVPPNVTFQLEDSSQDWSWEEPFDFIHMRDMHGSFKDFSQVYQQVAKFLTPTGTLEIANGGPFRIKQNYETSHSKAWIDACKEGMEKSGFAWWNSYADAELVQRSGLGVMKHKHMEIRLGEWTDEPHKRRLGRLALVACCESLESCSLRILTKHLHWSVEQVAQLNEKVKAELTDLSNEPCLDVEYIIAKRVPGLDV